jgi:hypothetical protein
VCTIHSVVFVGFSAEPRQRPLLLYRLLLLLLLPTFLSSLALHHSPYLVSLANLALPRDSASRTIWQDYARYLELI